METEIWEIAADDLAHSSSAKRQFIDEITRREMK